jgi:hypothetical protein
MHDDCAFVSSRLKTLCMLNQSINIQTDSMSTRYRIKVSLVLQTFEDKRNDSSRNSRQSLNFFVRPRLYRYSRVDDILLSCHDFAHHNGSHLISHIFHRCQTLQYSSFLRSFHFRLRKLSEPFFTKVRCARMMPKRYRRKDFDTH